MRRREFIALLGGVEALAKSVRRRDFIKGIAGGATARPLGARAQSAAKKFSGSGSSIIHRAGSLSASSCATCIISRAKI